MGDRFRRWTKILSAYVSTQTVVQLTGIAAGLLFVNFMPVREFALYTLASSAITFFTFFSDLGSTGSLVHFFHRTAKEGGDFSNYLAGVLSLRRSAFLLGAAAVITLFPAAASSKGFKAVDIGLVTLGILVAVWFQIAASVHVLALRLYDHYGRSYRAEIAGGGIRLLFALGMVATARLSGWLGILSAALGSATVARISRPQDAEKTVKKRDLRPCRREVLRYLLPTLPSAVYFSIRGPLVIWLAATFGSTVNIAEVGALGRLGLAVGLFSGLTGIVFLPRLARITDERMYRMRYFQFGGMLASIAVALFLAAALVPDAFLWILGEHYSGLHQELLLVVAGAGLSLLDGFSVSINMARSWTRWQGLAMLSLALSQLAFVMLLPLATTNGVLTFNLLSSAAALAGQLVITWTGFARPRWVLWR